jgi:hypothetical protein
MATLATGTPRMATTYRHNPPLQPIATTHHHRDSGYRAVTGS